MNKEDIATHFKEFKRCRDKWGIQDEDIYNFDETGCQIGITAGGRVIIPQGERFAFVNDPDNRELVTAVECFSATGYHVPPMLIFKGAYHLRKYFDNNINGDTLFARSETGFTNDILTMAWLKHFNNFTAPRTRGAYRMIIFDDYGSHITQDFLQYCWDNKIRPFQLPAHSTHLTQPAHVGAFQKYKFEFKKELRKHVFLGGDAVSKTDFFAIFQSFSDRTWSPKLCKSTFKKTGLIPYDPDRVLKEMNKYGGIQEEPAEPIVEREPSSPAFATPPPPPWSEFTTPVTFTAQKRGSNYVDQRIEEGLLTPTVKRVKKKCDKFIETKLQSGELYQARLTSILAYKTTTNKRANQPGTIVQKYGEIYGNIARRQIERSDLEASRVQNLIENH